MARLMVDLNWNEVEGERGKQVGYEDVDYILYHHKPQQVFIA